MGLGDRCDEIVRLIDETLAEIGIDPAGALAPATGAVATVTSLPPSPASKAGRRQPDPVAGPRPDQAAAGF
jgi:hypothetical protein